MGDAPWQTVAKSPAPESRQAMSPTRVWSPPLSADLEGEGDPEFIAGRAISYDDSDETLRGGLLQIDRPDGEID